MKMEAFMICMALRRMMGNFRLHEFNFLPVYTLVAEVKNQSFQNHLIKILQTFNASKMGISYMLFVYSFQPAVMSYLTQQKSKKKGQIMEISPSTLHLKATSGRKSNVMRPIET
mgnify:CR=1 FL=1